MWYIHDNSVCPFYENGTFPRPNILPLANSQSCPIPWDKTQVRVPEMLRKTVVQAAQPSGVISRHRHVRTGVLRTDDGTPSIHPSPRSSALGCSAGFYNERHTRLCPITCLQLFHYHGAPDKIWGRNLQQHKNRDGRMTRLFEMNRMRHFYVWLALFLLVNVIAVNIGINIGLDAHTAVAIPLAILTIALLTHLIRSGIAPRIGLGTPAQVPAARMWFYLPLWLLVAWPLAQGLRTDLTMMLLITITGHFIAIGILEEVLFRALLDEGKPVRAVIISTLTFGLGHMVSLLIGQGLTDTVFQVINATVVGFIFTMIVYLTRNLHVVIAAHILYNIMATATATSEGYTLLLAGLVVPLIYGAWLLFLAGVRPDSRHRVRHPAPAGVECATG